MITAAVSLPLVAVAYLVGSLPFGLWLARLDGVDLRAHGSGNIGATNVWRTTGGTMAAVVLVLDVAKGGFGVFFARVVSDDVWTIAACALAAVVGHVWPLWAGFKGGKGVAAGAGAFLALAPVTIVFEVAAFATVLAMSRYVSLASMVAAVQLPFVVLFVDGRWPLTASAAAVAALVVWRHRANIERLRRGGEPRVGYFVAARRRRMPFAE
jgi:glycerol-3-phosphate acyltransferase PlsY